MRRDRRDRLSGPRGPRISGVSYPDRAGSRRSCTGGERAGGGRDRAAATNTVRAVTTRARPHFRASTADDLMRDIATALLDGGDAVTSTSGPNRELWGAVLELDNPRARLSRSATRGKVFSPLGELCWYLAGSEDAAFIRYYVPRYDNVLDDGTVFGAYGPRMFGEGDRDQVARIVALLREKPSTRRAVVQVFDARDRPTGTTQPPCTCTLQFLVRDGQLNLIAHMRSNDLYKGLPHDLFAFTMLQELVARSIGVPVGCYVHMAGSLHLYDEDADAIRTYVSEGVMASAPVMPAMPDGDPWTNVGLLLAAEKALRTHGADADAVVPDDPYWGDLVRLLTVFALTHRDAPPRPGVRPRLEGLRREMACDGYDTLILERVDKYEARKAGGCTPR